MARFLGFQSSNPFQKLLGETFEVLGDFRTGDCVMKSVPHFRQYVMKIVGQAVICPVSLPANVVQTKEQIDSPAICVRSSCSAQIFQQR